LIETLASQEELITNQQIWDWVERVNNSKSYNGDDNLAMLIFTAGAKYTLKELDKTPL